MAVKVQSTIEPYNDSYKVVNAKNVGVGEDNKPLDEVLQNLPGSSGDITVDSELSLTSENPVQNKVIKAAFDSTNRSVSSIFQRQEEMGNHLDSLQNQVDNMGGGGGSGGVSSWNDLTDKPFGENEDGTVKQLDNKYLEPFERQVGDVTEFLPSCKGATTYSSDYGVYGLSTPSTVEMFARWHGIDESIAPIEGNIFVEFDGVTYECAQQRLAALDYAMAIGNCTPFGGTGNNEPFVVTIMQNGNFYTWLIACLSDTSPTEHTVRVYQSTPDKWLLKEEYLPFGVIAEYIDNYIDEALGGDY